MKSKTSFFNKTLFWKNITLYWPMWTIYTLILIFLQPVNFWSCATNWKYETSNLYSNHLDDFVSVLYMDIYVILIACMALFTGMALFHYLYNQKSANMIHAFPVDRKQLFGTNVISSLCFLIVPQMISGLLLMIVAVSNGITEIYYVLYWLGLSIATDITALAIVTFCAMITGHLLALPVYAVIFNYLSYWIYFVAYVGITEFGFGVNSLGNRFLKMAGIFSPLECFYVDIGLYKDFNEMGECIGMGVYGIDILLGYLLGAVVLYAAAYILYQKRHIEQAGEFLVVNWLKPVFYFAAEISGGIFCGLMLKELLASLGIIVSFLATILLILGMGVVAYFAANMIIRKSFHVFQKKNWINCAVYSVLLLLTTFGFYGIAKNYEDYQPEISELTSASIHLDYSLTFKGEDIDKILEIQKSILEQEKICNDEGNLSEGYDFVSISYELKNGVSIYRSYKIPTNSAETKTIFETITEWEWDEDNYLTYVFGENYENIELFSSGECMLPIKRETSEEMYGDVEWSYFYFTSEESKEMYQAILDDIKAGTLMRYNIETVYLQMEDDYSSVGNILLEYQRPEENNVTEMNMNENSFSSVSSTTSEIANTTYSSYVAFGTDCENIIEKLIAFGIISSVNDIY